jgi:hypothetical protein
MSINVISTTNIADSTPYKGKLVDGKMVVFCDVSGKAIQMVYTDGVQANQPIIPEDITVPPENYTSVLPRFGSSTASAQYKPAILSVVQKGNPAPSVVDPSSASSDTVMFVQPQAGRTMMLSKLWPLLDTNFKQSVGLANQYQPLVNKLFDDLKTYSLKTEDTYVSRGGVHVYKNQLGDVSVGFQESSLSVFIGDINVNNITQHGADVVTIVIATGKITLRNGITSGTSSVVFIGLNGVFNGSSHVSNEFQGTSITCAFPSNTSSGMSYTTNTGVISFNSPVTHEVTTTTKVSFFDDVYTIKEGTRTNVTPMCFSFTSYDGSHNDDDVVLFLKLQFAVQFHASVDRVIPVIPNTELFNGSYCVQYTIDDEQHESFVVFRSSEKSLPNAGVATESYCTDTYVKPMVQTYRVSEYGYAFYKNGYYITLNSIGDFVISDDIMKVTLKDMEVERYTLDAKTVITKDRADNLPDSFPEGGIGSLPDGVPEGGMDPFELLGGRSFSSHYSLIQKQNQPVEGIKECIIAAPYDSHIYYRPLNGRIDSIEGPINAVLDNGTLIVRNNNRRSTKVSVICNVVPCKHSVEPIYVNRNVCHHYNYNSDQTNIVYADDTIIDLLCHLRTEDGDMIDRIITLQFGAEPIDIFGDGVKYQYTYFSVSASKFLVMTTGGAVSGAIAVRTNQTNEPVSVNVIVAFGDMIQEKQPSVFTDSDEPFDYLARNRDGLVACHHRLKVPGMVNRFDGTCRTQSEFDALMMGGFAVSKYKDNEYTEVQRVQMETPVIKAGNILVHGVKRIKYSPSAPSTHLGLLEGAYPYDDKEGDVIVDAMGYVDTQLLSTPFTVGMNTYIGVPTVVEETGSSTKMIYGTVQEITDRISEIKQGLRVITGKTNIEWRASFDKDGRCNIISLKESSKPGQFMTVTDGGDTYKFIVAA